MKKLFSIIGIFAALALTASAQQQIITAMISVTNSVATTNGQTVTINGATRTWTNAAVFPQTQIPVNTNSELLSASNLYITIARYPVSKAYCLWPNSTNEVEIQSYPSNIVTVAISPGWGLLTLTTNTLTPMTAVRVPLTAAGLYEQTNVASGVVAMLSNPANTNQVPTNSFAFSLWYQLIEGISGGIQSYSTNFYIGTYPLSVVDGPTTNLQPTSIFSNIVQSISYNVLTGQVTSVGGFIQTTNGLGINTTITNLQANTNSLTYLVANTNIVNMVNVSCSMGGQYIWSAANADYGLGTEGYMRLVGSTWYLYNYVGVPEGTCPATSFPTNQFWTSVGGCVGSITYGYFSSNTVSGGINDNAISTLGAVAINSSTNDGAELFVHGEVSSDTGFDIGGNSLGILSGVVGGSWNNNQFTSLGISTIQSLLQQGVTVSNSFSSGTNFISGTWFANTNIAIGIVVNINPANPSAPSVFGGLFFPCTNNSLYTNIYGMQYVPTNSGLNGWDFGTVAGVVSNYYHTPNTFPFYLLTYPAQTGFGIPEYAPGWTQLGSINVLVSNSVTSFAGTQVVIGTNFPPPVNATLYVSGGAAASYFTLQSNYPPANPGEGNATAWNSNNTGVFSLKTKGGVLTTNFLFAP